LEKERQLWKIKPPGEGHKALQTHKKIVQGPLRAIEWIGVEKKPDTYTHKGTERLNY